MAVERDNLITPGGYKKLVEECERLAQERSRVVEEVSDAARQGDRSENAEYIYGKKRLREIDSRTRFLSKRMERARVVDPAEMGGDIILFGATVRIEDEQGKCSEYQIVGEDEFDVSHGKISWKSPVGAALLKKRPGDDIEVETPRGPLVYRILSFRF